MMGDTLHVEVERRDVEAMSRDSFFPSDLRSGIPSGRDWLAGWHESILNQKYDGDLAGGFIGVRRLLFADAE